MIVECLKPIHDYSFNQVLLQKFTIIAADTHRDRACLLGYLYIVPSYSSVAKYHIKLIEAIKLESTKIH